MLPQDSLLKPISPTEFFAEYWQKKPLLIRNAIPQVNGLLVPDDLIELAQQPQVTARLITQQGSQHEQWKVRESPLTRKDFKKLPPLWTLLVHAVDHFSLEVASLWQYVSFIPAWRRDDIMVSYAPKGGSVGRHFDQYDVFLVQGYGHRRWQLGQYCTPDCVRLADQPLQLLPELEVCFDEVLAPGDLLYVPPTMAHYGVAQDDCMTYSFGFRMPHPAQLMDELTDQLLSDSSVQIPLADLSLRSIQPPGQVTRQELNYLKQQVLAQLASGTHFDQAIMRLLSETSYPDSLPHNEPLSDAELKALFVQGASIMREPAARLLYHEVNLPEGSDLTGLPEFWALGENLEIAAHHVAWLKQLADGQTIDLGGLPQDQHTLQLLTHLYENAIILFQLPDE